MADHSDGPAVESLREDPAATTTDADSEDEEEEEEEEGEGFTFAAATRVGGGRAIGPVYLVFGRPRSPAEQEVEEEPGTATVRVPLRQLLLEERGSSSSSSGKRADDEEEEEEREDELDGVPAETYCLWSPGTSPSPSPSPSRCQKSGSTGSVLRWRQRLQVGRSHSDGKEKFVFLQPQQDAAASPGGKGRTAGEPRGRGGVHGSSHRGRGGGGGGSGKGSPGRRASTFLPYKQDLLGLFTNAGALRRSYHPF